jgi:hypothetical protein
MPSGLGRECGILLFPTLRHGWLALLSRSRRGGVECLLRAQWLLGDTGRPRVRHRLNNIPALKYSRRRATPLALLPLPAVRKTRYSGVLSTNRIVVCGEINNLTFENGRQRHHVLINEAGITSFMA